MAALKTNTCELLEGFRLLFKTLASKVGPVFCDFLLEASSTGSQSFERLAFSCEILIRSCFFVGVAVLENFSGLFFSFGERINGVTFGDEIFFFGERNKVGVVLTPSF